MTHLFQAIGQIKPLVKNSLNDPILASPALSGNQLYLRSEHYLWCLEPQQQEPPVVAKAPDPVRPRQPELKPSIPTGQPRQPKQPAQDSSFDLDWIDVLLLAVLGVGLVLTGVFFWLVIKGRRPAAPSQSASPKKPQATVAKPQSKPELPRSIPFPCSGCEQRLRVASALAGKKIKCPKCGQVTSVPRREASTTPGAPS